MKKLRTIFKPYMLRPALYQCVTRCITALTAILLWNRFLNSKGPLAVLQDGCLTAAVVLFVMAWFSYLRLDGVSVRNVFSHVRGDGAPTPRFWEKHLEKRRRRRTGSIVDFVDEHITTMDELDDEEKCVCKIVSGLISGTAFLFPAVMALLLS